MFKNKKVLITGDQGMIGQELRILLEEQGARVFGADLKNHKDLKNYQTCLDVCIGMDYVFHLMSIKGSPKRTNEKPVDFMAPMLQCDTNMIMAAQVCQVKKFLYTSSIAVLNPKTDKYPAWAKQTAENLIEAMGVQYPKGTKYCIVRPANVYGRFDNFKNPESMVVTSLIRKALTNPEIEVWGDGTEIREFVNAKEVAQAMILTMKEMPGIPVNVGGGKAHQIKQLAEYISEFTGKPIKYIKSEKKGAKIRVMNTSLLKSMGFKSKIYLKDGVEEAIEYARKELCA